MIAAENRWFQTVEPGVALDAAVDRAYPAGRQPEPVSSAEVPRRCRAGLSRIPLKAGAR